MKNALIIGASSDIGKALAHKFASRNYHLVLALRNPDRLNDMLADLRIRYNVTAEAVAFDAGKYEEHFSFYHQLKTKPDVAITVFGYLGSHENALTDFSETEKIILANFTGAVSILNIIANDFEQRKSGTIIGISSVAGDRGRKSNYIYGSAKAGFSAYLSGLRNRLFPSGVHVMTVKPGFVKTKMTEGLDLPEKLTALPEQVAENIYDAFTKGKNIIYTLPKWKFIMLIIKSIPESIFKKLSI